MRKLKRHDESRKQIHGCGARKEQGQINGEPVVKVGVLKTMTWQILAGLAWHG